MDKLGELLGEEEYDEALKLFDKDATCKYWEDILNFQIVSNNKDIIPVKVGLLTVTERFKDALKTFEEGHLPKDKLAYERAYAMYRLGRFQAALNTLNLAPPEERNDILRGQILYRLNRFQEAADLFSHLNSDEARRRKLRHVERDASDTNKEGCGYDRTQNEDEIKEERLAVNCLASITGLVFFGDTIEFDSSISNYWYETEYNHSMVLAAKGEWGEAMAGVQFATGWAKDVHLSRKTIDEVMDREMAPYLLQEAFIYQHLDEEAAMKILHSLPLPDLIGVYNRERKIDRTSVERILNEGRLNAPQRATVMFNMAIVFWNEGKLKAAARILRKLCGYPSLKAAATPALFKLLIEMNAIPEIKERCKTCPLMAQVYSIWKGARRQRREKKRDNGFVYQPRGQLAEAYKTVLRTAQEGSIQSALDQLEAIERARGSAYLDHKYMETFKQLLKTLV